MSSQPPNPTPPLPVQVWGDTHRGQVREINEDSFYCPTKPTQGYKQIDQIALADKGQLLIVADGVGGSDLGQLASQKVVQTLRAIYYESPLAGSLDQRLSSAVQYANDDLYQRRMANRALGDAGSTVVAAVIHHNTLYLANAGDSRAYLIRAGQAFQRTKDHTLVADKQALNLPISDADQGVITRSLGEKPVSPADVYSPTPLQDGDAVLLCSDGLSDMVSDQDLAKIISANSPRVAVQKLIRQANRAGGPDNITAVIAKIGQAKAVWGGFSLKTLTPRQKMRLGIAFVIGAAFWALVLLLATQPPSGGTTPTAAPSAPAMAAPAETPTPGGVAAPTAATSIRETVTLRPTLTPTHTPAVKINAAGEPASPPIMTPGPTAPLSSTPVDTPIPKCLENQFWDPVMSRCKSKRGSDSSPLATPPIESSPASP
jgi:PPM family protein phosphatase